ncbi:TetR/AcrR family transcriptional regulator [Pseudophaeobacter sp.]|uniref:TetR/AcrR family transcriptional regulator n=1 Tax=Pseudophaeobacter sp. TaxID=1971739 RepID=UPI004059A941
MARLKSPSRHALVDSALKLFWKEGYHAVSMGDLVRETGVSRGSIYSDFSGKEALFHACLDRYQEKVVTPAFSVVEEKDAGLRAIRHYLENLLARSEAHHGPDSGCLVLNTLAQVTNEDAETMARLRAHDDRLQTGIHQALARENKKLQRLEDGEVEDLARFTLISIQGLWSQSRGTKDTAALRQYCDTLLDLLATRLGLAGG